MKLIVGLGNPGQEYAATRHNVGFMVLDRLVPAGDWTESRFAHALYAKRMIGSDELEFLKPLTYMNNSGQSVAYAASKHELDPVAIVVIHDDLDVPLGEIRIRLGGGTAGHNGVASVAYHLKTPEFWRVRIGIGPHEPELITKRTHDTTGFVLSPFHPIEQPVVDQAVAMVCSALESTTTWEPQTFTVDGVRTTQKG